MLASSLIFYIFSKVMAVFVCMIGGNYVSKKDLLNKMNTPMIGCASQRCDIRMRIVLRQ